MGQSSWAVSRPDPGSCLTSLDEYAELDPFFSWLVLVNVLSQSTEKHTGTVIVNTLLQQALTTLLGEHSKWILKFGARKAHLVLRAKMAV